LDVASFLKEISEVLTQRGISSRELDGLDFEADGRDVSIRIRREPHGTSYPPLATILDKIGGTCLEQGVVVARLNRIAFLHNEITVELAGGADQPRLYRYPIEGVPGAVRPEPTPMLVEGSSLGSSQGEAKPA
jgi:hypothetical protein